MLRKLAYNQLFVVLLRMFFGMVYKKKYLQGRYFDVKRMGWLWAFRSLPNRLFGDNRHIPFPVHPRTIVANAKNLEFDINDIHVFQTPGCYWQNHSARIILGKGCYVAPNVGIITTNHDLYDLNKHVEGKEIVIGDYCWLGMNSVILPGVNLGSHTVVGAGSVVTRSFPEGYCVVGGNPARVIKKLDPSKFSGTKE